MLDRIGAGGRWERPRCGLLAILALAGRHIRTPAIRSNAIIGASRRSPNHREIQSAEIRRNSRRW